MRTAGHTTLFAPGVPTFDLNSAACRDANAELFFPVKADSPAHEAKAVCRECPVRRACAAYALARPELAGVWGGLTESERNAWRARCRACGSKRCAGGAGCDEARQKRAGDE